MIFVPDVSVLTVVVDQLAATSGSKATQFVNLVPQFVIFINIFHSYTIRSKELVGFAAIENSENFEDQKRN